jgi:hypothetical protein
MKQCVKKLTNMHISILAKLRLITVKAQLTNSEVRWKNVNKVHESFMNTDGIRLTTL